MIIAYCMRVTTVPVVLPFEWVSFPPPPPHIPHPTSETSVTRKEMKTM